MNYPNNPLEDLHRLTEAVKAAHADIAPTYLEYTQLAFAIATDCGEAGRADFMTLCSISPKYDAASAERLFTNALRTHKNSVHLGTAFHLARQYGVEIMPPCSEDQKKCKNAENAKMHPSPFPHTRARNNKVENIAPDDKPDEETEWEGTEPHSPLPTFQQDYKWPAPLDKILSFGKTAPQRDVLLLGALTVLGASLSLIVRCMYSRKWQHPCLQTFVVAPAAAGKGVLVWVRKLIEPIHDEIRSQVAEAMKAYRKEKAAYEALGKARKDKEAPERPPNRMFIFAGNNTGTGLLQNIIESGGVGIICESEADTISTAIKGEHGNWSETLRNAFDHGRLSYNRRTDNEYLEVINFFLSVLISGTPAQVEPIIPSSENGQFSRNIFYYMPGLKKWVNQFDETEVDVESEFFRMGCEWKATLEKLKKKGIYTLKLTRKQKEEFNDFFSRLFQRSHMMNGGEMTSSVVRMAINLCRMMSVVALLRSLEVPSLAKPDPSIAADNLKDGIITRYDMAITDEDFRAVLALGETLYLHATHILSFMGHTEVKNRGMADKEMLFAEMPQEFTCQQLLEKAQEKGIPQNTALSWLQRLKKKGGLIHGQGKGIYIKM